jgi:hypothetical protein
MKNNVVGRPCSTYGGGEVHTGFWVGEGDHLEETDVDERIK